MPKRTTVLLNVVALCVGAAGWLAGLSVAFANVVTILVTLWAGGLASVFFAWGDQDGAIASLTAHLSAPAVGVAVGATIALVGAGVVMGTVDRLWPGKFRRPTETSEDGLTALGLDR